MAPFALPSSSPLVRLAAGLAALATLAGPAVGAEPDRPARRVVSMNPSLTETLVALGATAALVGVDEYSARLQPEARDLPTVGGLFNPSLEAIVALAPDLVVLVPSAEQRDLRRRLDELEIEVLPLPNITLGEALASIEALGVRVGRAAAARARVGAIRQAWDDVRRATRERRRLPTVLVLQREPLFVVGSGSWLHDMLETAGAENLGARLGEPYPRAAVEWLIASAPELLIDATENADSQPLEYWSRWPSLPAVASGRAVALPGDVIRPGPYLDRSLRRLAAAVTAAAEAGAADGHAAGGGAP